MFKVTTQIEQLFFDLKGAEKDLDAELEKIQRLAAQAWLRTVLAIVPTWSGQSRASLEPLAEELDIPFFANPAPGAPDRRALGRSQGSFFLGRDQRDIYLFRFETRVAHLVFNENNDARNAGFRLRNPTPYHAFRQAQEAFFRVARPRLKDLQVELGVHLRLGSRFRRR